MTTHSAAPVALPRLPDSPRKVQTSRIVRRYTLEDWLALVGAAGASTALVWLVFEELLGWHGIVGFAVLWYVIFVAFNAALTSMSNPRTVVVDRIVTSMMYAGAILVAAALATTIIYTFVEGAKALAHLGFFTHDMAGVAPTAPLNEGGIRQAIIGTIIEVAIAVAIALPLGVGTAIYLSEVRGPFSRAVRTVVEATTALPEILAGLFIYVALVVGLGMPKSGFAVSIAMTVTMVPIIARSGEVALRVVPGGLREASLALGASHWRTVRLVVVPAARVGLATALILSIARGIGETAVPLLLSGSSDFTHLNPFNGPMNSLPLFIFTGARAPGVVSTSSQIQRAFGAASVLLVIVLILFVIIRLLARGRRSTS
jgi:phosphate transport system permease protein